MEYRKLGRSDLVVSSFGMGGSVWGREIDAQQSFKVMDHAFERGINFWDTADAYGAGSSETVVGQWIKSRGLRGRIILATKVGGVTNPDMPDDRGMSGPRIVRKVEESLRRLQTDHIDLYQFHFIDTAIPMEEQLEAMDRLVRQGKIRYYGCSNWPAWQIVRGLWLAEHSGWAQLESVQPPYNLVQTEIETELLPMTQQMGIGVITYSPLGAGFLTGKYSRGGAIPAGTRFEVVPGHQGVYFHERNWRIMETLRAKAQELGMSMTRLAMAWVVTQPALTVVLVGAREIEQIDNAFESEAMGLSAELRAEMSAWGEPR
jgi:1-deoxyxylulose-5-phosphate synthase